ncbi:MAG: SprB repeat-containing protein [Bacteroidales bacterium]|nr:SprB repeat-containing protein [Bacteroidales bacterium]
MMKSRLVVKYMMHCVAFLAAMLLLGVEAWGQTLTGSTTGCAGDVSTHITVNGVTENYWYRVVDENGAEVAFAQQQGGQTVTRVQATASGQPMLFFVNAKGRYRVQCNRSTNQWSGWGNPTSSDYFTVTGLSGATTIGTQVLCKEGGNLDNKIIWVQNAEPNVRYYLYRDGNQIAQQTSANAQGSVSFNLGTNPAAGVYKVKAQVVGCSLTGDVSGSLTIANNGIAQPSANLVITPSGTCQFKIQVTGTTANTLYLLEAIDENGVGGIIASKKTGNTGGTIDFGTKTSETGKNLTYYVYAQREDAGNACRTLVKPYDGVFVPGKPEKPTLNDRTFYYCGDSGVDVVVPTDGQSTYTLKGSNNTNITEPGGAGVVTYQNIKEGTYYVTATNAYGCEASYRSDDIKVIKRQYDPDITSTLEGNYYCLDDLNSNIKSTITFLKDIGQEHSFKVRIVGTGVDKTEYYNIAGRTNSAKIDKVQDYSFTYSFKASDYGVRTGTYEIWVEAESETVVSCQTKRIVFQVNPRPDVPTVTIKESAEGLDRIVCEGEDVVLNAAANGNGVPDEKLEYFWYTSAAKQETVNTGADYYLTARIPEDRRGALNGDGNYEYHYFVVAKDKTNPQACTSETRDFTLIIRPNTTRLKIDQNNPKWSICEDSDPANLREYFYPGDGTYYIEGRDQNDLLPLYKTTRDAEGNLQLVTRRVNGEDVPVPTDQFDPIIFKPNGIDAAYIALVKPGFVPTLTHNNANSTTYRVRFKAVMCPDVFTTVGLMTVNKKWENYVSIDAQKCYCTNDPITITGIPNKPDVENGGYGKLLAEGIMWPDFDTGEVGETYSYKFSPLTRHRGNGNGVPIEWTYELHVGATGCTYQVKYTSYLYQPIDNEVFFVAEGLPEDFQAGYSEDYICAGDDKKYKLIPYVYKYQYNGDDTPKMRYESSVAQGESDQVEWTASKSYANYSVGSIPVPATHNVDGVYKQTVFLRTDAAGVVNGRTPWGTDYSVSTDAVGKAGLIVKVEMTLEVATTGGVQSATQKIDAVRESYYTYYANRTFDAGGLPTGTIKYLSASLITEEIAKADGIYFAKDAKSIFEKVNKDANDYYYEFVTNSFVEKIAEADAENTVGHDYYVLIPGNMPRGKNQTVTLNVDNGSECRGSNRGCTATYSRNYRFERELQHNMNRSYCVDDIINDNKVNITINYPSRYLPLSDSNIDITGAPVKDSFGNIHNYDYEGVAGTSRIKIYRLDNVDAADLSGDTDFDDASLTYYTTFGSQTESYAGDTKSRSYKLIEITSGSQTAKPTIKYDSDGIGDVTFDLNADGQPVSFDFSVDGGVAGAGVYVFSWTFIEANGCATKKVWPVFVTKGKVPFAIFHGTTYDSRHNNDALDNTIVDEEYPVTKSRADALKVKAPWLESNASWFDANGDLMSAAAPALTVCYNAADLNTDNRYVSENILQFHAREIAGTQAGTYYIEPVPAHVVDPTIHAPADPENPGAGRILVPVKDVYKTVIADYFNGSMQESHYLNDAALYTVDLVPGMMYRVYYYEGCGEPFCRYIEIPGNTGLTLDLNDSYCTNAVESTDATGGYIIYNNEKYIIFHAIDNSALGYQDGRFSLNQQGYDDVLAWKRLPNAGLATGDQDTDGFGKYIDVDGNGSYSEEERSFPWKDNIGRVCLLNITNYLRRATITKSPLTVRFDFTVAGGSECNYMVQKTTTIINIVKANFVVEGKSGANEERAFVNGVYNSARKLIGTYPTNVTVNGNSPVPGYGYYQITKENPVGQTVTGVATNLGLEFVFTEDRVVDGTSYTAGQRITTVITDGRFNDSFGTFYINPENLEPAVYNINYIFKADDSFGGCPTAVHRQYLVAPNHAQLPQIDQLYCPEYLSEATDSEGKLLTNWANNPQGSLDVLTRHLTFQRQADVNQDNFGYFKFTIENNSNASQKYDLVLASGANTLRETIEYKVDDDATHKIVQTDNPEAGWKVVASLPVTYYCTESELYVVKSGTTTTDIYGRNAALTAIAADASKKQVIDCKDYQRRVVENGVKKNENVGYVRTVLVKTQPNYDMLKDDFDVIKTCKGDKTGSIELINLRKDNVVIADYSTTRSNYNYQWHYSESSFDEVSKTTNTSMITPNIGVGKTEYKYTSLPEGYYKLRIQDVATGCYYQSATLHLEAVDPVKFYVNVDEAFTCEYTKQGASTPTGTITGRASLTFTTATPPSECDIIWKDKDGNEIEDAHNQTEITGLASGTYTVTVTPKGNGSCGNVVKFVINPIYEPTLTKVETPVTCYLDSDGKVEFDIFHLKSRAEEKKEGDTKNDAATTLYAGYNKFDGEVDFIIDVASVSITKDADTWTKLQTASGRYVIGGSTPLEVDYTYSDVATEEKTDGGLELSRSKFTIKGLRAGTYILWLRYKGYDDCLYPYTFTIGTPSAPVKVERVAIQDITCNGQKDGVIEVTDMSGGNVAGQSLLNYTYSLAKFGTDPAVPAGTQGDPAKCQFSALEAGKYTLTVEDAKGCKAPPMDITIYEPDKVQLTESKYDPCNNTLRVELKSDARGWNTVTPENNPRAHKSTFQVVVADGAVLNGTTRLLSDWKELNAANTYLHTFSLANDAVETNKKLYVHYVSSWVNTTDYTVSRVDEVVISCPDKQEVTVEPMVQIETSSKVDFLCPDNTKESTTTSGTTTVGEQSVAKITASVLYGNNKYHYYQLFKKNPDDVDESGVHTPVDPTPVQQKYVAIAKKSETDNSSYSTHTFSITSDGGNNAGEYILKIYAVDKEGAIVSATDCYVTKEFTINQPSDIRLDQKNIRLDSGKTDGLIELNDIQGGVIPYTYYWKKEGGDKIVGSENKPMIDGLASGKYTIVLTDANGCYIEKTFEIAKNKLNVKSSKTDIQCVENEARPNGSIKLSIEGLYPFAAKPGDANESKHKPYYTITLGDNVYIAPVKADGDTNAEYLIEGLSAGKYSITVTDGNGGSFDVPEIEIIQASNLMEVVATKANLCEPNKGELIYTIKGGAKDKDNKVNYHAYLYKIEAKGGEATSTIVPVKTLKEEETTSTEIKFTDLSDGWYRLVVYDWNSVVSDPTRDNTCNYVFEDVQLTQFKVSLTPTQPDCANGTVKGALEVVTENAIGDLKYKWQYKNLGTDGTPTGDWVDYAGVDKENNKIVSLNPALYKVSVTDAKRVDDLTAEGACALSDEQLITYQKDVKFNNINITTEKCAGDNNNVEAVVALVGFSESERAGLKFEYIGPENFRKTVTIKEATGAVAEYRLNSVDLPTFVDASGKATEVAYKLVVSHSATGCEFENEIKIKGVDKISFDFNIADKCQSESRTLGIDVKTLPFGAASNTEDAWMSLYTLTWTGDSINGIVTNQRELKAPKGGLYTLDISYNDSPCRLAKSIFLPSSIGVDVETFVTSCTGQEDGKIVLTVSPNYEDYVVGKTEEEKAEYPEFGYTYTWKYSQTKIAIDAGTGWGDLPLTAVLSTTDGVLEKGPKGFYRITIKNSTFSCEKSIIVEIKENEVKADIQKFDINSCDTNVKGAVEVKPTAGVGPFVVEVKTDTGLSMNTDKYRKTNVSMGQTISFRGQDENENGLAAGKYLVIITDSKGCTYSQNIEITAITPVTATVKSFDFAQSGKTGKATITVAGGRPTVEAVAGTPGTPAKYNYRIEWLNKTTKESGFQNYTDIDGTAGHTFDLELTGLPMGEYAITVKDSNPASDATSCYVETTLGMNIILPKSGTINPSCSGNDNGKITLEVYGKQAAELIYKVTGKTNTVETEGTLLEYEYATSEYKVKTSSTLSAPAVSGSDPATVVFSGLKPGDYTIEVYDPAYSSADHTTQNAVVKLDKITLAYKKSVAIVSATAQDATCYGNTDGAVTLNVNVSGIENAYIKYDWVLATEGGVEVVTPTRSGSLFTGFGAGKYTVTVSDSREAECKAEKKDIVVKQDPKLTVKLTPDNACTESRTISVAVTSTSGTYDNTYAATNYDFQWSGTGISRNQGYTYSAGKLSNIPNGGEFVLSVAHKTHAGCPITERETLNDLLTLTVVDQTTIDQAQKGTVTLSAAGGVITDYTYYVFKKVAGKTKLTDYNTSTTAGSREPKFSELEAGDYIAFVKSGECEQSTTFTIAAYTELNVTIGGSEISCAGNSDALLTATATGGYAPYTYQWSKDGADIVGATSYEYDGAGPGSYTVTVTDAKGGKAKATKSLLDPISTSFQLMIPTGGDVDKEGKNGKLKIVFDDADLKRVTTADTNNKTTKGEFDAVTGNNEAYYWEEANKRLYVRYTKNSVTVVRQLEIKWEGANISAATPFAQTGLVSGSYSVVVTMLNEQGAKNCATDKAVTFVQPLTATYTAKNTTCTGNNTGEIVINPVGGQGNYTFMWEDVSTTEYGSLSSRSNLKAGTYKARVRDERSRLIEGTLQKDYFFYPSETGWMEIVVLPTYSFNVSGQASDVTCFEEQNGSIGMSVSGGSGSYTFEWSGSGLGLKSGLKVQNQNQLSAGTYRVVVRDEINKCEVSQEFTVGGPTASLEASYEELENVKCSGGATGALKLVIRGGVEPYSYKYKGNKASDWTVVDAAVNGVKVENLKADNYQFVVTDAHGCQKDFAVVITEPELIKITGKTTNVTSRKFVPAVGGGESSYEDTKDGSITISIKGGTPQYHFKWYNVDATKTGDARYSARSASDDNSYQLSGLSVGDYAVKVTEDGNGCESEYFEFHVGNNGQLTVTTPIYRTTVDCSGEKTGIIRVKILTGYAPYTILVDGKVSVSNFDGSTEHVVPNLGIGTYMVTVLDSRGAKYEEPVEIKYTDEENLQPVKATAVVDRIMCYGGSDANIYLKVEGGKPYTETVDGTTQTYYNYNIAPSAKGGKIVSGQTTITGLPANTYTITVTDAHGCPDVIEGVELQEHPEIKLDNFTVTDVPCKGNGTGAIMVSVSGGTGSYKYNWQRKNSRTSDDDYINVANALGVDIHTNQNIRQLNGGYYKLTISCENLYTDGDQKGQKIVNGEGTEQPCIAEFFFTVKEPVSDLKFSKKTGTEDPNIEVTHVSCHGEKNGQIAVTLEGGTPPYRYEWHKATGEMLGSTTAIQNGLGKGEYYVNVFDANGCQISSGNIKVEEPDTYYLSVVKDADCEGSNGNIAITQFNATSGKYEPITVDKLDNYKPKWAGSFTPEKMTAVNATPTVSIEGLNSGYYSVELTKTGACTISRHVELQKKLDVVVDKVNPSCNGVFNGSIMLNVTGGSGKYDYKWYTKEEDAAAKRDNGINGLYYRNGLTTGKYYVVVSDKEKREGYDSQCVFKNGAKEYIEITLEPENDFKVEVEINDVTCFENQDGKMTVNVLNGSGDYTYTWTGTGNGLVNNSQNTQTGLSAGNYSVVIEDQKLGCRVVEQRTVGGATQPLMVNAYQTAPVKCYGESNGEFELNIVGGKAPYRVQVALSGDVKGEAKVITTAGGANTTNSANVTVTGTSFDSGDALAGFNGKAGTYMLYVTDNDGKGCEKAVTVTIDEPQKIKATYDVTGVTSVSYKDNGDIESTSKDGKIAIKDVDGGTKPYKYKWYESDKTTAIANTGDASLIASNLDAKTYYLQVIDKNGCQSELYEIPVGASGALNVTVKKYDATCKGGEGRFDLTISNGTKPYNIYLNEVLYLGNYSEASLVQIPVAAGTYAVRVTDAKGGEWRLSTKTADDKDVYAITITEPSKALTLDIKQDKVLCYDDVYNGSSRLTIKATADGATPDKYSFTLANNGHVEADLNQADFTGLMPGKYVVIAEDGNHCKIQKEIDLVVFDEIKIAADVENVTCAGAMNGSIDLKIEGLLGEPTYEWKRSSSEGGAVDSEFADTSEDLVSISGGYYTVTITDTHDGGGTCSVTKKDILVKEPIAISVTPQLHKDVTCLGASDGKIAVTVRGGTRPYTYAWYNSITGEKLDSESSSLDNISEGIYHVIVTDANGCTGELNNDVTIKIGDTTLTADKYEVKSTKNADTGVTDVTIIFICVSNLFHVS